MSHRRGLALTIVAMLLTGCVAAQPAVVRTVPSPPPLQVEIVPPQPAPAYVWIPGHWAWRRRAYVWEPGHWALPVAPQYVWIPGHWAPRPGGYAWVEGHWRVR